jgi:CHAT domain-containing protein/Tfp pilus assembly protein PilF
MIRKMLPLLAFALCLGAASNRSGTSPQEIRALLDRGKYAEAERAARSRLQALSLIQGTDSLQVAGTLDLLAEALRRSGNGGSTEARQTCERALRIKAERLGRNDPDYAVSLYQLGYLLYVNGDYDHAKPLLERSLKVREEVLGPEDRAVAEGLMPLAGLLSDQGNQAQAESLFTRAMNIRVREFGPTSAGVGECLSALATLHFRAGDFVEAVSAYEQALPILKRTLGDEHPKVGTCLNNLGALLYEMGDYESSLSYFGLALKIRRQALGSGHELVASTLVNMGMDLAAIGRVTDAEIRYNEALAIQEHRFGGGSPEVGRTLVSLGLLHLQTGANSKARSVLSRAVSNLELPGEADPPELSDALAALATAEATAGKILKARSMYERALRIREGVLGQNHPDVGLLCTQFARVLSASGDQVAAIDMALRGETISREHLRLTSRSLSERQALQYAKARPAGSRVALGALESAAGPSPGTVADVWDAIVQGRTLVLDEMALRTRAVAAASDSSSRAIWDRLVVARRRLANLLVAGARGESPSQYRAQTDRARNDMDQAERAWASRSSSYRAERNRERINLRQVESSIPSDGALVAFALAGDSSKTSYVAFVARPGQRVTVVPIGRTVLVDAKVAAWLSDITREAAQGKAERKSYASGEEVRRVVWDPIENCVRGAHRLFVVPEGAIHLVNFAALPAGHHQYLIEGGLLIHYLTAERDLVPTTDVPPPGKGMLALGNPYYGAFELPMNQSASRQRGAEGRASNAACLDFDSLRFGPLPGSGREAQDVARIWGAEESAVTMVGSRATEGAFKAKAPGRNILHIATHGFFLGECATSVPGSRGIGATVSSRRPGGHHPLLLAGLALAGANRRALAAPDEEDGILTAEEVASLDLSGVQWAVLSGCDTGNGRVVAGEGILGLQRAFEVAGVRTVIMSLWAIDDDATRTWMNALYQGRITRKLDTTAAVAGASLQVLRERRAQARSTNPFYWAGFVAAGDWR